MLIRGRELIQTGWTQEALARTSSGRVVSPTAPNARRFCLVGALMRAEYELLGKEWENVELPVAYDGSPAFVTALTLLSASATLTIVHPREFSSDPIKKVWAWAALRATPRGLVDVANDIGSRRKHEVLAAYDLAVELGTALDAVERSEGSAGQGTAGIERARKRDPR